MQFWQWQEKSGLFYSSISRPILLIIFPHLFAFRVCFSIVMVFILNRNNFIANTNGNFPFRGCDFYRYNYFNILNN